MKLETNNDLRLTIKAEEKEILVDEVCCTSINILMNNDGNVMTSFLGVHNPEIIKTLERALKAYFKGIKKTLKAKYKENSCCCEDPNCQGECHEHDCNCHEHEHECHCHEEKHECHCGDEDHKCDCHDEKQLDKKNKKSKKTDCGCGNPECKCGDDCQCDENNKCSDDCKCGVDKKSNKKDKNDNKAKKSVKKNKVSDK